jgi:hypothetical protein
MRARLIKTDDKYFIRTEQPLNGLDLACYPHSIDKQKLSLINCKEIESGHDLEELVDKKLPEHFVKTITRFDLNSLTSERIGFRLGFKMAFELIENNNVEAFKLLKKCYDEAPLDFLGTGSNSSRAAEEEAEWRANFETALKLLNPTEWDVEILFETDEPTRFQKRTVIRKLDNGEECEWTCFWDEGWWDSSSGIRIPGVISWEPMPVLDTDGCLILKRVV